MEKVEWGEYIIGDLFEKVKTAKLKYKTSELPNISIGSYTLPALTAGIQNQGLNNFVPTKNTTVLEKVISISANGANTGATFFQSNKFTVLQDAYAINIKKELNYNLTDNQYLFFTNAISKAIYGNFEWTNKAGWEKVKNEKIKLPIKNDKIDFGFMDTFIAELEVQRITELEAYLLATGLKDYELTDKEKQAINDYKNIYWSEYKIQDLFSIDNTLSFNCDKLVDGTTYDYITRTSFNQGILRSTGFVNNENINPKDIWSLGLMQMDFFYRKKPWYAGQYIRKIAPKIKIEGNSAIFFTTLLNMKKQILKNVLVRNIDETFLGLKIKIPTKNEKIDFEYIETLISAIQKLIIKDIVLYIDKKLKYQKMITYKNSDLK